MFFLSKVGLMVGLAVAGYGLFKKINFPAPSIMGPMMSLGIYQVLGGGLPEFSLTVVNILQITIGLSLGARINDQKLADLRKVLRPSLVIAVWTLLSTFGMTFIIYQFIPNGTTALFAAAPGGISEMTVLALVYGSEVPIVSTYQFVRLVVIITVVPLSARWLHRRQQKKGMAADEKPDPPEQPQCSLKTRQILPLYLIGILGGLLLLTLNFPGGGVVGAMAALAITNVLLKKQYIFPNSVMQMALIGIGMSIGLEFSPEIVRTIQEMLLPIIGFSFLIVLSNLAVGWYIRHLTHWDMITCLLASAPGGLSQMLAAAEEMKADPVTVSILQLVRLLIIITCIPLLAPFFV